MNTLRLLPILIAVCTAGCATVATSTSAPGSALLEIEPIVTAGIDEHVAMPLAEIGRPLTTRNARAQFDWAGALGITRDRVRSLPVVRSLRAVQPAAFDHLGVTIAHGQVGLSFSTRF